MEVIALQEYTDKYISLYEGEIRNIGDLLATRLIEDGIVAEHTDITSGQGEESIGGKNQVVILELESSGDLFYAFSDAVTELYMNNDAYNTVQTTNITDTDNYTILQNIGSHINDNYEYYLKMTINDPFNGQQTFFTKIINVITSEDTVKVSFIIPHYNGMNLTTTITGSQNVLSLEMTNIKNTFNTNSEENNDNSGENSGDNGNETIH